MNSLYAEQYFLSNWNANVTYPPTNWEKLPKCEVKMMLLFDKKSKSLLELSQ